MDHEAFHAAVAVAIVVVVVVKAAVVVVVVVAAAAVHQEVEVYPSLEAVLGHLAQPNQINTFRFKKIILIT